MKWKQVNDYLSITNDATISGLMDALKGGGSSQFLDFKDAEKIILEYNEAIEQGKDATAAFLKSGTENDFMDDFLSGLNNGKTSLSDYKKAVEQANESQIGLTVSMAASKVAAVALNAVISMGIGFALSALTQIVDNVIHANENAIKSAEKLTDKYNNFLKTNSSNISTLKGLKSEFNTLSKGVSQFGDNISLTSEEYERYKEIIQQIVEMSPSLAEGYDTENGYLADKNKLIERAIELQEQERKTELGKKTNLDQLKTSMSGHVAEYKEALHGGVLSESGTLVGTKESTAFSNSIYKLFNTNNRKDFSNIDMAKQIMSSFGVEDVEKEIEKYFNKNGYWSESDFWDDYAGKIADNINVLTKSLSAEDVGLDEKTFDIVTQKAQSCAQVYSDMIDNISLSNNSIQTELGQIAEYTDSYSTLSSEQKKFVSEYLKGFGIEDISSEKWGTLVYDEDKMSLVKNQIIDLVEKISGDETLQSALTNMYAPPDDKEPIEEYLERFNSAFDLIKEFCSKNAIEIPYVFTEKKTSVDNLAAEYETNPNEAQTQFNSLKTPITAEDKKAAKDTALDKFNNTAGNINTLKTSLATLYSGNYSSEELVNSIKNINSAVSEMGGSLNWDFIEQQSDSLDVLGGALDYITEQYADSILADSGIESDSALGQMLQGLVSDSIQAGAAFEGLTANIDAMQSSYSILTKAVAEYNESGFLSLDTLQSLITADSNYITMLEIKNGQLAINENAYRQLVTTQMLEFRSRLETAAAAEIEALSKEKAKAATLQNADASLTAVSNLNDETLALNENTSEAIANAAVTARNEGASEEEIQAIINKYSTIWDTSVNSVNRDLASFLTGNIPGGSSSAGGGANTATDPHVTDFDEKYDKLKDLRDRDILNEKQYLDALRALNEKYYKNDKKYTDQYEKYKKEYLDGMLSLHESVISIATKQIDKYISSLEDQKGAAVDSLKEQQDAAKEALEAQKDALEEQIKLIDKQIDAKQAEIDAINEENEAHENTINLEKEQYELERLRNQRTEFTYSGKEKGFVYRTDTGAIRDQEQNVKEAEDKIRIAGIEKEISLLEKQKDALKDQQDAIDEQIDKVDEYYGKIIEDTETYWDGMIQGAENAKSEWEKMGDAIEEAEDKVKLASVGIDPDDPNALLSEETIRNFKEMHDSLMADVYAGNSEMLNALSELENVNLSSLTGYLSDTQEFMEILAEGVDFENLNNSLGSVMNQFSKVAEAAGIMTGSVVGTTGVSVGKNNGTNASPSQGSGNGNISFIDAVAGLEKESVPMLNNVADAFAGGEDSEDSTQSIAGSVEAAKAAIAGSSSGKKSSAEGENSSGEDSGSLMEAMAAQSQAALDEETGIPAQIQKWQELNGVLSGILENLRNIAAIIPLLNPQDGNFSVTSGTTGITQANGGLSHGDKNAMVSEYGQLETIIRRNGTYQITSSPTLTDLNPGDIVLNNSKTLALIRSKRRAASSGVKNLSLASPVLFSSALPELQPRNSVLAQSNAAAASPIFADNHQNNKIDVTIGDIILENVRDTDTLSRQIVMRLPTQIKQELSKRG